MRQPGLCWQRPSSACSLQYLAVWMLLLNLSLHLSPAFGTARTISSNSNNVASRQLLQQQGQQQLSGLDDESELEQPSAAAAAAAGTPKATHPGGLGVVVAAAVAAKTKPLWRQRKPCTLPENVTFTDQCSSLRPNCGLCSKFNTTIGACQCCLPGSVPGEAFS